MSVATAQRSRRKRVFRCTFSIEGIEYTVHPIVGVDATVAVKAYRMTRRNRDGNPADSYDIRLSPAGFVECDCKGFLRWNHCRHVRTLQALGCLPRQQNPEACHETSAAPEPESVPTAA
jgi:hypothetical protein